ncbi:MAG: hypothetical protein CMN55_11810, partial [Sneathiella sp.]|nr:hypothetical protein [Sneathiella sp.]
MVAVQSGAVIAIPADFASKLTFSQSSDSLVLTSMDGIEIILRNYFATRTHEEQPLLQIGENGPFLEIEQVIDKIENFDATYMTSQDDPPRSGASFTLYNHEEIGDGLDISDLLSGTNITLNTPGFARHASEIGADSARLPPPNVGSIFSGTADITAPTLTITADDFSLAEGQSTTVYFTFSEEVTGFDISDVAVEGGLLSAFTQLDGSHWTATFTQDGADPPALTVADHSYTDLTGNLGTGDSLSGTADIVAPTLTITADDFSLAEGQSTTVYFTFSEDITGFDIIDVTVEGGLLSAFTQLDASHWTATFTQDGADPPAITVADHSYTDLTGNLG